MSSPSTTPPLPLSPKEEKEPLLSNISIKREPTTDDLLHPQNDENKQITAAGATFSRGSFVRPLPSSTTAAATAQQQPPLKKIRKVTGGGTALDKNPYNWENPPHESQLFIPTRTKNKGNYVCIRLIAPPLPPEHSGAPTTEWFSSDTAVGAWCTLCKDSVWWKKGESNGISRHMMKIHPGVLKEAGFSRENSKVKEEDSKKRKTTATEAEVAAAPTKKRKTTPVVGGYGNTDASLATDQPATALSALSSSQTNSAAVQAKLDALSLYWCCHDLRPFSVVQDKGLEELLAFATSIRGAPRLCPDIDAVKRWATSLEIFCADQIQQRLTTAVQYYSLTFDVWPFSPPEQQLPQSFLSALAIHYVTAEFDLKTLVLHASCSSSTSFFSLVEKENGGSVSDDDVSTPILDKWALDPLKLAMVVRSGGGNFPFESDFASAPQALTVGHALHLICGPFLCADDDAHAMENVDIADFDMDSRANGTMQEDHVSTTREAVGKIRHLVRAFPGQKVVRMPDGTVKTLILQDNESAGWGSAVVVLGRAITKHEEIAAFAGGSMTLDEDDFVMAWNAIGPREWALATGIWILMIPFQSLVDACESDAEITMIYAYPLLSRVKDIISLPNLFRPAGDSSRAKCGNFLCCGLEKFIGDFGMSDFFDSVVTTLEKCQETLRQELNARLGPLSEVFSWAAVLDPRLRKLNHCTSDEEREKAKQSLLSEMVDLTQIAENAKSSADTTRQPKTEAVQDAHSDMLQDMFGDVFDQVSTQELAESKALPSDEETRSVTLRGAEYELAQYFAASNVPKNVTAFDWWKSNHITFPMLARVARKWLSTLAMPTPKDRLLSGQNLIQAAREGRAASNDDGVSVDLKLKVQSLGLTTQNIANCCHIPVVPPSPHTANPSAIPSAGEAAVPGTAGGNVVSFLRKTLCRR